MNDFNTPNDAPVMVLRKTATEPYVAPFVPMDPEDVRRSYQYLRNYTPMDVAVPSVKKLNPADDPAYQAEIEFHRNLNGRRT